MPIMIHNNKILVKSGKVAVSTSCCCADPSVCCNTDTTPFEFIVTMVRCFHDRVSDNAVVAVVPAGSYICTQEPPLAWVTSHANVWHYGTIVEQFETGTGSGGSCDTSSIDEYWWPGVVLDCSGATVRVISGIFRLRVAIGTTPTTASSALEFHPVFPGTFEDLGTKPVDCGAIDDTDNIDGLTAEVGGWCVNEEDCHIKYDSGDNIVVAV